MNENGEGRRFCNDLPNNFQSDMPFSTSVKGWWILLVVIKCGIVYTGRSSCVFAGVISGSCDLDFTGSPVGRHMFRHNSNIAVSCKIVIS